MVKSYKKRKFQFVEQIQWRTSIRGVPVYALCEPKRPGHMNAWSVLCHCVPNQGLYPLRRESGYPLKAKGVTRKVTPFAFLTVLRAPSQMGTLFLFL